MLKRILLIVVLLLIVAQFIRPARTNAAIDPAKELQAPQPVAAILQRSCNDCHSNRTVWPWYAQVAPVSWLLARDVRVGRQEMNLSEWTAMTPRRQANKLKNICEQVEQHDMPLWFYLPLHPKAKLTDADRKILCDWSKGERAKVIAAHPEAAKPPQRTPSPRG
jgi:hypothetical protein